MLSPWSLASAVMEVALTNPSLTAEITADNRHFPLLMKLAVQSKKGSLCAVSTH